MTTTLPTPSDKTPAPGRAEEFLQKYNVLMPEISQTLGQNRIIELIAEGGMANVYKVWHQELEIIRAVKILKPGFNDESKERLRTEAKISAHLNHPNIVELYGVHFWNDMVPYLEMEYVDGMSLKQLLDREKRLPFTVAVSILRFVCNALHYAHNQVFTLYGKSYEGIVHRDIKPANILITRDGAPKLADFGIAKPMDISLHTVGQKVMGTFTYLSPEQLNGEPLDRRSDIYSLGAVLYECITGEKAFPQKTLADLIRDKLRNQYRSISSLGIAIPKKLEQIIDKSMQINREKRYNDAEEFGDDLYDVLKKTTEEAPERIIAGHLMGSADAVKPADRKKRNHLAAFLVASFFLACTIVCAVFVAEAMKSKRLARSPAKATAVMTTRSTSVDTAPFEPVVAMPAERTTQPHGVLAVPNTPPVKKDIPDPLESGLSAYRSLQFSEAIPLLQLSLQTGLKDSLRQYATVCLLESYLSVNNLAGAQKIVESEKISDGYYFLLAGRAFHRLGRLPQAIDALFKAQETPSAFKKKEFQREATYLWAKSQEEQYDAKPNADNKRRAGKAWEQFVNTFCTAPDRTGQCRDSRDHLKNLQE